MSKHVFIIPEPHIWDKSFKNRVNYQDEIFTYLNSIISSITSYDGEKIIIFPGDVFHRGFTSISSLVKVFNLFAQLNDITHGNVYSCVGNHELSYSTNNPFWMLAEDTTDRYPFTRVLEAYSAIKPGIKIVDSLTVNSLDFVFGHYERVDYTNSLINDTVLITHNTIAEKEIVDYIHNSCHRNTAIDYITPTSLRSAEALPQSANLKYVFVGHMHSFYSAFDVDETFSSVPMKFHLQYLGSLGRTAINEIDDTDLVRTIPHFVVNETTYTYDPFTITLLPRGDIVKESVVAESAAAYSEQKTIKDLRSSNVFGETPEECIERELQSTPEYLYLFNMVYHGQTPAEINTLIKETLG